MTVQASGSALTSGARRYAMGLLLAVSVLNLLDRQVVNILAEPIKQDLGLADWQLGVLTGLAFAIFYTLLGLPIARLAERSDRARIIGVAVVVWSLFTALCGLATNFLQLLAARIGVGVGEAGCTPPAHSLISDYVPPGRRASALAFYSLGVPLGSLAGMIIGGLVAGAFGWRAAFWLLGVPGVLIGLLVLATLPEPRRALANKPSAGTSDDTFKAAMAELHGKPAFVWTALAATATAFVSYGHIAFLGSFYLRNHGDQLSVFAGGLGSVGLLGLCLGAVIGIAGSAGTWIGGVVADRAARSDIRGYLTVPSIAILLAIPPFLGAMLASDFWISLLLLAPATLLSSLWYGPVFATVQSLVRPQTRATAAAVLLFIINLLGLGLGPVAVGGLSDLLAQSMGEAAGVRWALIAASGLGVISAAFYLVARARLPRDIPEDALS